MSKASFSPDGGPGIPHSRDWIARALTLAAFCHLFFRITLTRADPDLWSHLAFGRLFIETGCFPFTDVFAYTPVKPVWVAHNWLSSLIYYSVWDWAGGAGLQVLKYALGLATGALLLLAARRAGADARSAALGLLLAGCGLSIGYMPLRGQLWSFLNYAAAIWCLESARDGKHWSCALLLVPLYALWANLHAGVFSGHWPAGIYCVGCAWRQRRVWPWAALLAALLLATLATPYGVDYWAYVLEEMAHTPAVVEEWKSLPQALADGMYANVGLVLGVATLVLLLGIVSPVRDWVALGVLAFTAALSVKNIRHETYFMLSSAVYVPAMLTRALSSRPRASGGTRFRLFVAISLVLLSLALSGWWLGQALSVRPLRLEVPDAASLSGADRVVGYPKGALRYLAGTGGRGRLLPTLQWGSYALWTLSPGIRVGMDGRFRNIYPDEVIQAYFDFLYATPRWREYLERYGADFILIRKTEAVAPLLLSDPSWRVLYDDNATLLFGHIPTVDDVTP